MKTRISSRGGMGILVVVAVSTSFESGGFRLVGAHTHTPDDGFEYMPRTGAASSVFKADRGRVTAGDHLYVVGDGGGNVSLERVLLKGQRDEDDDEDDDDDGGESTITSSASNGGGGAAGGAGEDSDENEGMSKTAMIGIIIGAVAAGLVVLAIAVAVLRKVCCSSPSKAGEGAVVTATPAEPSNPSSVGRPPNSSAGGSKTELPMAYAEAIVIAKPVRRSAPARDNNV